ncbi:hypothetical protein DPS92_23630 [Salmonella enterica subsp. enterica serovar Richmond]|uniref:hypothetical protein n=1 Tax=Salmonella enterica TaxID=28901 RepID=UPI000FBFF1D3|nr:hypothetical protein [Salmonella enterica subsp. enterica serovar Richmond]EAA2047777.1 hypothetical protein [Salmonella enterica subsp. enterica serovar Chester]EAC1168277.1 hypothetical protein [Salmonella enterica subsp. enterica serovar Typhimurium]EAV3154977.1 hypothetical protein [Salmonella enterica]EBY6940013.1 hypothetical protein [Salmonella enterica subsp. enterica serovar Newport]EBZ2758153.1 hypothetical protein [Salmonella enterica subsp. enterica serovar Pomona]ECD5453227.1 
MRYYKPGMIKKTLVAVAISATLYSLEVSANNNTRAHGTSSAATLSSVGHRPVITSAGVFTDSSLTKNITSSSTSISKGDQLFIKVDGVNDPDSDILESEFYCNVYGLNDSGKSSLVVENIPCTSDPDGTIPVDVNDDFRDKRIIVDVFAQSDESAAQMNGYTPVPLRSLAYRITSANAVVDSAPIPFLRPAYAEVNGRRIDVDRGDPDNPHDDVIYIPSAFAGAKIKVFIEGGTPKYKVNTVGTTFSTVTNFSDTHSAEITIKDNFINSPDGFQTFSVLDGGGRPGGNIINFKIKAAEMFLSRPYKANWNDAKSDCETSGYIFPALRPHDSPETLSHSTLFWGGYAKYSFPNASENHWTGSELGGDEAESMTLDQPNSVVSGYSKKALSLYFVCKKTF